MRDDRVDLVSAIVAAALLAVAVGFALIRQPTASRLEEPADSAALGRETWRAECASCHPAADALRSGASREHLIDLLVYGDLRSGGGRGTLLKGGHPAFDHLSDASVAAVLNHVASGSGEGRLPALGPPHISAAEVGARRRGGR